MEGEQWGQAPLLIGKAILGEQWGQAPLLIGKAILRFAPKGYPDEQRCLTPLLTFGTPPKK